MTGSARAELEGQNVRAAGADARPSVLARVLIRAIHGWQHFSTTRSPRCRFEPSCSKYTEDAIRDHGAVRGAWLGVRRIARCRPGGGFGFDPAPPRLDSRTQDGRGVSGKPRRGTPWAA
ncbi:MAG: membrane protein insertion efficiency factor YidD [Actinobacteria bacterium]|nr:membrane protein insertion efficiency factor YidD [Actinomycetota bacterium]